MPDSRVILVVLGILGSAGASIAGTIFFAGQELGEARGAAATAKAEVVWWRDYANGLKEELAELRRTKTP